MFISDLNILETVEVSAVVGGTFPIPTPTGIATGGKLITLTTLINQNYNTGANSSTQSSSGSTITSVTSVVGNGATTNFDNSALGINTTVTTNVSNTTIAGVGSESSGSLSAGATR